MKIKRFKKFINESAEDGGTGLRYLKNKGVNITDDIDNFEKKYKTFLNFKNREQIIPYNYKGVNGSIIKNPKTLENIGKNVRGIIDKDGDFFVEASQEIVHTDILLILERLNLVKNVRVWWLILPTEFITVQRIHNDNLFVLGESNEMMYDKQSKEYKIAAPIFQKFLDKAKIKNPHINFENIVIDNYMRWKSKQ